MSDQRRLISAIEVFVRHRQKGSHSKRHVTPLVRFAEAELVQRGIPQAGIIREAPEGCFYSRTVDLVVQAEGKPAALLFIITQSGSVRKNLNNRRRDIVGDSLNLRLAYPQGWVGLLYLLRADAEATRRGKVGTNPIEELTTFLIDLQQERPGLLRPLLDGAALIAAEREPSGRIRVEKVRPEVDVRGNFFDRMALSAKGA